MFRFCHRKLNNKPFRWTGGSLCALFDIRIIKHNFLMYICVTLALVRFLLVAQDKFKIETVVVNHTNQMIVIALILLSWPFNVLVLRLFVRWAVVFC